MAVSVGQVHGVFQVVEGVALLLAFAGLHEFSLATAALRRDHLTAQLLPHRHGAAQVAQIPVGGQLGHHQAEGFIAVDQVVEHHLGPVAHLHPRPAGGIEEGVAPIGALVGIQTRRQRAAAHQHQGQQHSRQQRGPARGLANGSEQHGNDAVLGRILAWALAGPGLAAAMPPSGRLDSAQLPPSPERFHPTPGPADRPVRAAAWHRTAHRPAPGPSPAAPARGASSRFRRRPAGGPLPGGPVPQLLPPLRRGGVRNLP